MTRFFRFLIFMGYAGAAAGIAFGFFGLDWREPTEESDITVGWEFARLAVDDFRVALLLVGADINANLVTTTSEVVKQIIRERWPAIAVYFVALMIPNYAIQALGAFVVFVVGRPFYPHGRLGGLIALTGIIFTTLFTLISPLFILYQFYEKYLNLPNQTIAAGFWVTGGGVILGGTVSLMIALARYFVPHPLDRPRRPRRKKDKTFGQVPAGYSGDEPAIYDPYKSGNVSQQDTIDNVFGQRSSGDKRPKR